MVGMGVGRPCDTHGYTRDVAYAEVLFESLVGSLSLAVALRVVTRGEVEAHVESRSE